MKEMKKHQINHSQFPAVVGNYKSPAGKGSLLSVRIPVDSADASIGKKMYLVESFTKTPNGMFNIKIAESDGSLLGPRGRPIGARIYRKKKTYAMKLGAGRFDIPLFSPTEAEALWVPGGSLLIKIDPTKTTKTKTAPATQTAKSEVAAGTFGEGSDIKQYRGIAKVKTLLASLNEARSRTGVEYHIAPDGSVRATIKVGI